MDTVGKENVPPSTASTVASPHAPKYSLIKDVEDQRFYDMVGQVVRTYQNGAGKFTVYVSDYTSNDSLFNYEWGGGKPDESVRDGDEFSYAPARRVNSDWPGPFGRMTLMATLFSPHSDYAEGKIKEGDNVFIRNLRIKAGRDSGGRLEGVLHTNKYHPDRIDISIIKDPEDDRIKELLKRKRAYWKRAKREEAQFLNLTKNQKKRPRAGGKDEANDDEGRMGRPSKKRKQRVSNTKEKFVTRSPARLSHHVRSKRPKQMS